MGLMLRNNYVAQKRENRVENTEIMVSVLMTVYNHEKYIRQAIEGVLMQQTNFKFELIIGEDCSNDGTRCIIQDYERRYTDIIKVIYQPVNIGAQNNTNSIYRRAKGKYWALCEGDDYWTDKHKLQKQIDFLENHTQYSAVYHNVICVDKGGRPCKRKSINKYPHKVEQTYTLEMLRGMAIAGQTASLVCRNLYKSLGSREKIKVFEKCGCNGDHKVCKVMACVGQIYFMENEMACHRVVLNEGSSYSTSIYGQNTSLHFFHQYTEVYNMIQKLFHKDILSSDFEKQIRRTSLEYMRRDPNIYNIIIYLKLLILPSLNRIKRILKY